MTWRRSAVLTLLVACFIAFSIPDSARAGVVVYTDPALFAAQVLPGDCSQDFTALSGSLGNNVPFCGSPGSAFAYSAATVDTGSELIGANGLSTALSADVIMLSFTGLLLPTAAGGNFFSDSTGPLTVGVSTDGGANFTLVALSDTTAIPFLGFTSYGGAAFTNMEVYSDGDGFPTIQSLDVGTAVPEPGSLALLGSALVGLALLSRKRQS